MIFTIDLGLKQIMTKNLPDLDKERFIEVEDMKGARHLVNLDNVLEIRCDDHAAVVPNLIGDIVTSTVNAMLGGKKEETIVLDQEEDTDA